MQYTNYWQSTFLIQGLSTEVYPANSEVKFRHTVVNKKDHYQHYMLCSLNRKWLGERVYIYVLKSSLKKHKNKIEL